MAHDGRRRGMRRRAVRQAARETGEDIVLTQVALRVGQLLWYVATYPLRLLARALDGPL